MSRAAQTYGEKLPIGRIRNAFNGRIQNDFSNLNEQRNMKHIYTAVFADHENQSYKHHDSILSVMIQYIVSKHSHREARDAIKSLFGLDTLIKMT